MAWEVLVKTGHALVRYPARSRAMPVRAKASYVRVASKAWSILTKRRVSRAISSVGRMMVDPGDLIGSRLYFYDTWEPAITVFVREHAPPCDGEIAIDIGANIGYYSLMFSRLVGPAGSVYAIEPSPLIRTFLEENLVANGATNVTVVPFGISDRREIRTFELDRWRNLGASRFGETSTEDQVGTNALRLVRLTDVVAPQELSRAAIIKIDVEGLEDRVLKDLHESILMLGRLRLVVAELRFDADGEMNALVQRWMRSGFQAFIVPNRYDVEFYAARDAHDPIPVQQFPPGQHDIALLRKLQPPGVSSVMTDVGR